MNRKIKIKTELSERDLARLYTLARTIPETASSVRGEWIRLAIVKAIDVAFHHFTEADIIK